MKFDYSANSAYLIAFINFIGFYAIIILVLFLGFEQQSRYFTIPARLLVAMAILLGFYLKNYRQADNHFVYWCFLGFFLVYFFSLYTKAAAGKDHLIRPEYEVGLYSFIYAIIPFLYFAEKKEARLYRIFYNAIIASGLLLSVLCLYLYGDILLSGYSRISLARHNVFFQIISPLLLSYSGALILGLTLSRLFWGETSMKQFIWYGVIFLFGLIPFFLGASRGSVVALLLPFMIISLVKFSRKIRVKTLFILGLFTMVTIFLAAYVGTGVFTRVLRILHDIQYGGASVVRLEIWSAAIDQFLSSPIFGSSIGMEKYFYPHNIFIEVLMSTGLIGFLPFALLIIYSFHKSFLIIKHRPEFIWITVLFWQGFILQLFSGALYTAVFFWSGLGLITGIDIKNRTNHESTVDQSPKIRRSPGEPVIY
jgi:O-antigen ligase